MRWLNQGIPSKHTKQNDREIIGKRQANGKSDDGIKADLARGG
ncbi:hypothetical protein ACH0BF_06930 [Pseudobacillus sp. 179-B 2D1 NHS]